MSKAKIVSESEPATYLTSITNAIALICTGLTYMSFLDFSTPMNAGIPMNAGGC